MPVGCALLFMKILGSFWYTPTLTSRACAHKGELIEKIKNHSRPPSRCSVWRVLVGKRPCITDGIVTQDGCLLAEVLPYSLTCVSEYGWHGLKHLYASLQVTGSGACLQRLALIAQRHHTQDPR